jgi:predicted house-cleaning NTP pyrophosphatase (Maf/HAM1 superfamily)
MKDLTSEEIADYVNSGEWEGKAGAYAIQDSADKFILNLDGSFTNVVGLPMELLGKMLRKIPALACEIQDRPPASPFQAPEDGR